MKILLVKLISHNLTTHGTGHLELYSAETGKYIKHLQLLDLVLTSFSNCLWVLEKVTGLKEQALGESLDLLLMFLSNEGPASLAENRT